MRAGSVVMVGFGLDSTIETIAAAALLWRLYVSARGSDAQTVERAERTVHRIVGVTFILLALYVVAQVIWTFAARTMPEESPLGIAIASASLIVMPLVAWGKIRAARALDSSALRAEAKETLACTYLSFTMLLGLAAHAALGWWWADPVAALLMVPWLIQEGREGLRGEECSR